MTIKFPVRNPASVVKSAAKTAWDLAPYAGVAYATYVVFNLNK